MKKLFKWLLLLTVVLAVAVVALLYNPGLIKGPLERYLSGLAGYSISLEGDLEIDLGRQSELTAKNIRISGPDWASHPDLVGVGGLKIALDTASLFSDIIVLESLQVDGLQLSLETDAEGKGNWLTANTPPPPNGEDTDDADIDSPAVIFKNIEVSNTTLRFRNGKTGVRHVLNIASLKQHHRPDGMLYSTLNGDLNTRSIECTATVGPYKNLLHGRDISYSIDGHLGDLKMSIDGFIDDLLNPRRPIFNLDMQGPNIDEITAMLGLDDLGAGGFSLHAKGGEVGELYEADINGKVGDVSLSVSVQASDLSQLNEFDLNLGINGPSLGAVTRILGLEDWPDKPFSLKGDAERIGGTLNVSNLTLSIGGTQLALDALLTDFPTLDASRIKLSISGDDVAQFHDLLGIPGIATGSFYLHGKLDVSPEGLELLQVELETSLGRATLSGTLGPAPSYAGSKLQLHLDGNNAHSLVSAFGIDALPEQPFNLNTRVELVENGVRIERGVLVTIEDDRLELGGFVSFNPGINGTDVEMGVSGQDLAQVLRRLVGDFDVPDQPYELSGRVQVLEEGIQLDNVKAEFEAIKLTADGLIKPGDRLLRTGLNFKIDGENLSSLRNFPAIGDSLDIFVPGQAYRAAGRFSVVEKGWQLNGISGRIGNTDIDFDALISNQPGLSGSNVSFSIKGPGLKTLLVYQDESDLPPEPFVSSGQVLLSANTLSIKDFNFESDKVHGEIDLKLGWPISAAIDTDFDVNIWGDDIRQLLPPTGSFEAKKATYKITTVGKKQGDLISLKQFNTNIGDLRISLKGKLGDDPTDMNADIILSATSKDISTLGRLNGENLPALALDLKASFNGNARQFAVRNLVGLLGKNHLEGSLDVSLTGPKPNIKLTAKSNYIDIRPFQVLNESDDETETASDRKRLIPATPLPLDALAAADITMKLNIAELRHLDDSIKNLVLEAETRAGSLKVSRGSFDAPRGKLKTSFSIVPTSANRADVKIDLTGEKLVLNLSGMPKDKLDKVPALDIDLHASGRGDNLQELAGSINGSFYIGSKGGALTGVDLSLLDTFILEDIFSLIMPKSDETTGTLLTCAATILEIKNGMIKTKPALAFTTDRITIITKGTLDLKTEKMKFNFNATPNNALQISAGELFNPYILISGTLSKPDVGLDPAKVLLHGGAAIGTAGISILAKGLLDRVGNTVPLCEEMLKQAPQR